jgi:hypothetical protein
VPQLYFTGAEQGQLFIVLISAGQASNGAAVGSFEVISITDRTQNEREAGIETSDSQLG